MDRLSVASAGLAHAIAHLSGSQQICVVTESPEETLATVAGLIRAADYGRDRFALLMPKTLTDALPELLAHTGIGLSAALETGLISVAADAPGTFEPREIVARFHSGIGALSGPWSRRFAIVDFSHLCLNADPRGILALQVALGEAATAFSRPWSLPPRGCWSRSRSTP